MRVVKLKSNKHIDLIMGGDSHVGPTQINLVTRVRPTTHGEYFKELVARCLPETLPTIFEKCQPPEIEAAVKGVVAVCELATMEVLSRLQLNPALAVNIPSYDTLMQKLRGAENQPPDGDKIVSLAGRQGEEP